MSDLPPNPPTLATPTPKTSSAPPLLLSSTETNTVSINFPSVLQDAKGDTGADVFTVMNGGLKQITQTTECFESETEVASPPIFRIIATNKIDFGGSTINVLNDPVQFNGKQLAPSNPTASQYMAQRGQQVFTHFSCTPVRPDSQAFLTRKRATLFIVRRSSFILP